MSTIRVSVIKNAVHGVTDRGNFVMRDYTKRTRLGRTEEFREGALPTARSLLSHYLESRLEQADSKLGDEPVVVMVHGFLFDPKDAMDEDTVNPDPSRTNNPHGRLYHYEVRDEAEEIRKHTSSWPRHLGFEEDDRDGATGLAIAFGWQSQPGFARSLVRHFQNFYARAYDKGTEAAWNLATCLHVLDRKLAPGKKIDILCHSLGGHVVVRLLQLLAKHELPDILGRLDRIILLGGAEYVVEAQLMMKRLGSGAGGNIRFYNVVSRENDILDLLGENFGPRTFGNSNVIGHNGLDMEDNSTLANWLDLQIDGAKLMRWMKKERKLTVSGDRPGNVWDHWYYYTYRGNMDLYRGILRDRPNWDITKLRSEGVPDRVSRRWSVFGD